MPKNIKISSGSDFSKKIFGPVTKPIKPSFTYEGKVFSDTTFKNQRIIPYYKNETYYIPHGLPDDFTFLNSENSVLFSFNEDNQVQNLLYDILANVSSNPVKDRADAALSSVAPVGVGGFSFFDPYDQNPQDPPKCSIP